jgi:sugar O-acyltransferase (sialic acid O-acetyltransferase NeuD family)
MKVIIFGNGAFATLAWYCITHDSTDRVVGFTADAAYLKENTLQGLPVVDFANCEEHFPPGDHTMLVHLGPIGMNSLRMSRVESARAKGYKLTRYISSRAVIWPDLQIRENCVIYEGAVVQPFTSIGENVIIRSGVQISHNVLVGDHCFLAIGACLGGGARIGRRCFIGLNATILNGVSVADECLIAAGAVVTTDTEPGGVYVGVPARRRLASPS